MGSPPPLRRHPHNHPGGAFAPAPASAGRAAHLALVGFNYSLLVLWYLRLDTDLKHLGLPPLPWYRSKCTVSSHASDPPRSQLA